MTDTQNVPMVGGYTEVDVLPQLVCVGYITEFPTPKETASKTYFNIRFTLKGQGGSPDRSTNFLYRPEWLTQGFNPATIKELVDRDGNNVGESQYKVYQNNILRSRNSKRVTVLGAIAGSPENLTELLGAIGKAQEASGNVCSAEELHSVMKQFLDEKDHPTIGYLLKQKSAKNEDGGYELEEGYEVGSYYYPTDEAVKNWQRSARKDPAKYRVGFELA